MRGAGTRECIPPGGAGDSQGQTAGQRCSRGQRPPAGREGAGNALSGAALSRGRGRLSARTGYAAWVTACGVYSNKNYMMRFPEKSQYREIEAKEIIRILLIFKKNLG